MVLLTWLQDHLLPCPFKYLTGIDCPGCGFQRSVLGLLQGDVLQSFALYPPAVPLLFIFAYAILDNFIKLNDRRSIIKKSLYMGVAAVVLISYTIKMAQLYMHYKASS